MILLWGLRADGPLAAVWAALDRLGHCVEFLDQRKVLTTQVDLRVGRAVEGTIRLACGREIALGQVTAAYIRPHDSQRLPTIATTAEDSPARLHAIVVEDALLSWADLSPARVVNRPTAMGGNGSKPYQAGQIRPFGFKTPDTLITTDPDAALAFWEHHDTVVYKSISGVRSVVARLTREHLTRFDDLRWCPTQFQEYVPGRDYRVHVVGDEVFASEIRSDADDYRYAGRQGCQVEIRSHDLSVDAADRCRALAAAIGLHVAGIDLRRTPDGDWYCFEVNPSPGFTYYQEETGQAIDEAIARLLATTEYRPASGSISTSVCDPDPGSWEA